MTNVHQILNEREEKYGDFREQARLSQSLKWVMHDGVNWHNMTPYMQESLEMIQHKIARILNGDETYEDSWADIVGYAQLALDRLKSDNEGRALVKAFAEGKVSGSDMTVDKTFGEWATEFNSK
jgi:hypothetical protein